MLVAWREVGHPDVGVARRYNASFWLVGLGCYRRVGRRLFVVRVAGVGPHLVFVLADREVDGMPFGVVLAT
jgi:hypothetical protein